MGSPVNPGGSPVGSPRWGRPPQVWKLGVVVEQAPNIEAVIVSERLRDRSCVGNGRAQRREPFPIHIDPDDHGEAATESRSRAINRGRLGDLALVLGCTGIARNRSECCRTMGSWLLREVEAIHRPSLRDHQLRRRQDPSRDSISRGRKTGQLGSDLSAGWTGMCAAA